jgi:hypothetical protein
VSKIPRREFLRTKTNAFVRRLWFLILEGVL